MPSGRCQILFPIFKLAVPNLQNQILKKLFVWDLEQICKYNKIINGD